MERINVGTGIALGVALLVAAGSLGYLAFYGPAEHRGMALTAFIGLATTLAAAVQGRLVKRDPAQFEEKSEDK